MVYLVSHFDLIGRRRVTCPSVNGRPFKRLQLLQRRVRVDQ